jgi:hemerythrin-like domain-containing protein
MGPIEELLQEHDLIRTVLHAARTYAERIQEEGHYDIRSMTAVVEFSRDFTDRCHHGKEEELFSLLRESRNEDDLIETLLADHEEIRRLRREMAAALLVTEHGENRAILKLMDDLYAYSELLHAHFDREEREFFPRAAHLLDAAQEKKLTELFGRIEAETGEDAHARYLRLIARLAGE